MMINSEVMIIHPHWTATTERHFDQPLSQPWYGKDAVGDELPELRSAEISGSFQDQDDCELLRNLARVHRQKGQVSRAGTLDIRRFFARSIGWPKVRRPRRSHIPIRQCACAA